MKFRPLVRKLPRAPLDQLLPEETPGPQKTDADLRKVRKNLLHTKNAWYFVSWKRRKTCAESFVFFGLDCCRVSFPVLVRPDATGWDKTWTCFLTLVCLERGLYHFYLGQDLNTCFFITLVCLARCLYHFNRNLICKLGLVVTTNLEGWRDLFWLGNLLPADSPHPPLPGQESKCYDILDWLSVKYSLSPPWCKSVEHIQYLVKSNFG